MDIITSDKQAEQVGEIVYDYYSMKLARIVTDADDLGWFYVRYADLESNLLNGERICSTRWAIKQGWLDPKELLSADAKIPHSRW